MPGPGYHSTRYGPGKTRRPKRKPRPIPRRGTALSPKLPGTKETLAPARRALKKARTKEAKQYLKSPQYRAAAQGNVKAALDILKETRPYAKLPRPTKKKGPVTAKRVFTKMARPPGKIEKELTKLDKVRAKELAPGATDVSDLTDIITLGIPAYRAGKLAVKGTKYVVKTGARETTKKAATGISSRTAGAKATLKDLSKIKVRPIKAAKGVPAARRAKRERKAVEAVIQGKHKRLVGGIPKGGRGRTALATLGAAQTSPKVRKKTRALAEGTAKAIKEDAFGVAKKTAIYPALIPVGAAGLGVTALRHGPSAAGRQFVQGFKETGESLLSGDKEKVARYVKRYGAGDIAAFAYPAFKSGGGLKIATRKAIKEGKLPRGATRADYLLGKVAGKGAAARRVTRKRVRGGSFLQRSAGRKVISLEQKTSETRKQRELRQEFGKGKVAKSLRGLRREKPLEAVGERYARRPDVTPKQARSSAQKRLETIKRKHGGKLPNTKEVATLQYIAKNPEITQHPRVQTYYTRALAQERTGTVHLPEHKKEEARYREIMNEENISRSRERYGKTGKDVLETRRKETTGKRKKVERQIASTEREILRRKLKLEEAAKGGDAAHLGKVEAWATQLGRVETKLRAERARPTTTAAERARVNSRIRRHEADIEVLEGRLQAAAQRSKGSKSQVAAIRALDRRQAKKKGRVAEGKVLTPKYPGAKPSLRAGKRYVAQLGKRPQRVTTAREKAHGGKISELEDQITELKSRQAALTQAEKADLRRLESVKLMEKGRLAKLNPQEAAEATRIGKEKAVEAGAPPEGHRRYVSQEHLEARQEKTARLKEESIAETSRRIKQVEGVGRPVFISDIPETEKLMAPTGGLSRVLGVRTYAASDDALQNAASRAMDAPTTHTMTRIASATKESINRTIAASADRQGVRTPGGGQVWNDGSLTAYLKSLSPDDAKLFVQNHISMPTGRYLRDEIDALRFNERDINTLKADLGAESLVDRPGNFIIFTKSAGRELAAQTIGDMRGSTRFFRELARMQSLQLLAFSSSWFLAQRVNDSFSAALALGPAGLVDVARSGRVLEQMTFKERTAMASVLHVGQMDPTFAAVATRRKIPHTWIGRSVRNATEALDRSALGGVWRAWETLPKLDRFLAGTVRERTGVALAMKEYRRMLHNSGQAWKASRSLMKMSDDDIANVVKLTGSRQFNSVVKHVQDIMGDWASLTSRERALTAIPLAPLFYPFIRYSVRLIYNTLPKRHPIKAALLYELSQINTRELDQAFGLQGKEVTFANVLGTAVSKDKQGKVDKDLLNFMRFVPGGNVLTEQVAESSTLGEAAFGILPPASSAFFGALLGLNPRTGRAIQDLETRQPIGPTNLKKAGQIIGRTYAKMAPVAQLKNVGISLADENKNLIGQKYKPSDMGKILEAQRKRKRKPGMIVQPWSVTNLAEERFSVKRRRAREKDVAEEKLSREIINADKIKEIWADKDLTLKEKQAKQKRFLAQGKKYKWQFPKKGIGKDNVYTLPLPPKVRAAVLELLQENSGQRVTHTKLLDRLRIKELSKESKNRPKGKNALSSLIGGLEGEAQAATVKTRGGRYKANLNRSQRAIANEIIRVGRSMGASRKELKAAIETGLVESNLQNLPGGDGTSVGWRQEIDTYGSKAKRMNVAGGARRFFSETKAIDDEGMSAGQVAATVQRPAAQYRGRYDQRSKEAEAILAGTTTGKTTGGVSGKKYVTKPGKDRSQERAMEVLGFLRAKRGRGGGPLSQIGIDAEKYRTGGIVKLAAAFDDLKDVPEKRVAVSGPRQTTATTGPQQLGRVTGATKGLSRKARKAAGVLAAKMGGSIDVMSGFRPGATVKGSGRRSQHASGDAIDLPPSTKVAYHAGRYIGLSHKQALKFSRKGGVISTSRGQVLWRTNVGGDHYSHVHLGVN